MKEKKTPRGIRNNNPLNIRYSVRNNWIGKVNIKHDRHFEEFVHMKYGYRAAYLLLFKYINLYDFRTISDIVCRWAPACDGNDTIMYAKHVSVKTDIPVNEALSFDDWDKMTRIVCAMAEVENGCEMSYIPALQGYIMAAEYLHVCDRLQDAKTYLSNIIPPICVTGKR